MKTKMKNSIYLFLILIKIFSLYNCLGITELDRKIMSMGYNSNNSDSSRKANNIKPSSCSSAHQQYNEKFDNSECDMMTEGPICLYNGDRVLLPYATPKGLVGYWNFDEARVLDNSGNRNHGIGVVNAGPAFGGVGSSGLFTSGNYITIPANPGFQSSDFTITFWLFVVQDFFSSNKGVRYCPLMQRGNDDLFSKTYQRGPALYYDRKEKNLKLFIKTAIESSIQGENLKSNAKVTSQRWLHISLVKMDTKLKIYVNGILDSSSILKSVADHIDAPLYIGNVPWLKDQCDYPFLIDEFRYYNIAIEEDFIQGEASAVLGGIEPSFLQLGCMNCSLKDASVSCVDGYRLCTSVELHTGGYQIARSMGWLSWNTHIWTHGALKTPSDFDKLHGLALCCADLK
jgi:hypothetical protein